MSSLNSFGSIMTFAIELEANLRDYYATSGNDERAKAADKRRKKLERARRESVVEITLEPIDGVDESKYQFNFDDNTDNGQTVIETTATQFYQDVAPKMNVRQARRALERCGEEHQALLGHS